MKRQKILATTAVVIALMIAYIGSRAVFAHCDTLDGPVIVDAKAALEKGDVTAVLKWVKKTDETEITAVFKKTLVVRNLSPEAKELADMYFFETLVRIHRAGEGAAYTGLKPAGTVEPTVAAADKAIETGSVDTLAKELSQMASEGVRHRFQRVIETKKHTAHNVEAGREYVKAYVEFVHYVENMHNLAKADAASHEHQHQH